MESNHNVIGNFRSIKEASLGMKLSESFQKGDTVTVISPKDEFKGMKGKIKKVSSVPILSVACVVHLANGKDVTYTEDELELGTKNAKKGDVAPGTPARKREMESSRVSDKGGSFSDSSLEASNVNRMFIGKQMENMDIQLNGFINTIRKQIKMPVWNSVEESLVKALKEIKAAQKSIEKIDMYKLSTEE